jgi:hypothetical protein
MTVEELDIEEQMGEEETAQQAEDSEYEERRTKEKALEEYEKLKQTKLDFTNYQKHFQDATQTLNSMRLLIGVEDKRLEKVAEDVNMIFNSINKRNVQRGSGGVYEEAALLLRTAMDFFEDRKELTELERAYLKVLGRKLFDAIGSLEGTAIVNKAIDITKEIISERISQNEQNIKDLVDNKLEAFGARIKAFEETTEMKEELEKRKVELIELQKNVQQLTEEKEEAKQENEELRRDLSVFQARFGSVPVGRPSGRPPSAQPLGKPRLFDRPAEEKPVKPLARNLDEPLAQEELEETTVRNIIGEEVYERVDKLYKRAAENGKNIKALTSPVSQQLTKKFNVPYETAKQIAQFFTARYVDEL